MIRQVLRMGDPRLLVRSAEVTDVKSADLHELIRDMRETMAHLNGAGLAAPQIGIPLRVVIFGVSRNPRYPDRDDVPDTVLVNPIIDPIGTDMDEDWEGCLSVPGLRGLVPRYSRIRYRGLGENGEAIDRLVEGFHGRVVQHECDHLDGVLYPARIRNFRSFGFVEELFPDGHAGDD